jgi:hypothetical protein
MELAAISSPAPPSALGFCAEATKCARRSRPTCLTFVESAGLAAVAYGPDSREQMDDDFAGNFWKMQNLISLVGDSRSTTPGAGRR